jgi:hypothetical protein
MVFRFPKEIGFGKELFLGSGLQVAKEGSRLTLSL